MVQNYTQLGSAIPSHLLTWPDLALSDYHLFTSMGHALAERHFDSYEDVRKLIVLDCLMWFASKDEEFFGMVYTNCPKDGKNV